MIPLHLGDDDDTILEEPGLIIVPNYLVAPAHDGTTITNAVYDCWRDCKEWRDAKRMCEAQITLFFNPVHLVPTVRIADHDTDLEDPVSRMLQEEADDT